MWMKSEKLCVATDEKEKTTGLKENGVAGDIGIVKKAADRDAAATNDRLEKKNTSREKITANDSAQISDMRHIPEKSDGTREQNIENLISDLGDYFETRFQQKYDEIQSEMADVEIPEDLAHSMKEAARKYEDENSRKVREIRLHRIKRLSSLCACLLMFAVGAGIFAVNQSEDLRGRLFDLVYSSKQQTSLDYPFGGSLAEEDNGTSKSDGRDSTNGVSDAGSGNLKSGNKDVDSVLSVGKKGFGSELWTLPGTDHADTGRLSKGTLDPPWFQPLGIAGFKNWISSDQDEQQEEDSSSESGLSSVSVISQSDLFGSKLEKMNVSANESQVSSRQENENTALLAPVDRSKTGKHTAAEKPKIGDPFYQKKSENHTSDDSSSSKNGSTYSSGNKNHGSGGNSTDSANGTSSGYSSAGKSPSDVGNDGTLENSNDGLNGSQSPSDNLPVDTPDGTNPDGSSENDAPELSVPEVSDFVFYPSYLTSDYTLQYIKRADPVEVVFVSYSDYSVIMLEYSSTRDPYCGQAGDTPSGVCDINGLQGNVYNSSGKNAVKWSTDGYQIVLSAQSNRIGEQELLKIARSITARTDL